MIRVAVVMLMMTMLHLFMEFLLYTCFTNISHLIFIMSVSKVFFYNFSLQNFIDKKKKFCSDKIKAEITCVNSLLEIHKSHCTIPDSKKSLQEESCLADFSINLGAENPGFA